MPAYAEPGLRVPVWLDVDETKEPRPTFYSRSLSMRQQLELGERIEASMKKPSDREMFEETVTLLEEYVDGWENMPEGFEWWDMSFAEARQLLRTIAYGQFMRPVEKKGLGLQPLSDVEKSASDAA